MADNIMWLILDRLTVLWNVLDVLFFYSRAEVGMSWISNKLVISPLSFRSLLEWVSESIWWGILIIYWSLHISSSEWIWFSLFLNSWAMRNITWIWPVKTSLSHILSQNFALLVNLRSEIVLHFFQLILMSKIWSSLSLFHSLIIELIISIWIWLMSILNNLNRIHFLINSLSI
jgi:hypothetical protein